MRWLNHGKSKFTGACIPLSASSDGSSDAWASPDAESAHGQFSMTVLRALCHSLDNSLTGKLQHFHDLILAELLGFRQE